MNYSAKNRHVYWMYLDISSTVTKISRQTFDGMCVSPPNAEYKSYFSPASYFNRTRTLMPVLASRYYLWHLHVYSYPLHFPHSPYTNFPSEYINKTMFLRHHAYIRHFSSLCGSSPLLPFIFDLNNSERSGPA